MPPSVEDRARLSLGSSAVAIYRAVGDLLAARRAGGTLLDVGCGKAQLRPFLGDAVTRYIGSDVVRYDEFPADGEFVAVDLDIGKVGLPNGTADVVAAVETIEHLENPRAFARELTRLARPGGWVLVTTPNQLSVLSKLGLLVKNEFPAFRGGNYPAHLTALLEIDLRRIAAECGWTEVTVAYSRSGRMPGVRWHWPRVLSRLFPRAFSDNVIVIGHTPRPTAPGT